jgi:hypothetical protein
MSPSRAENFCKKRKQNKKQKTKNKKQKEKKVKAFVLFLFEHFLNIHQLILVSLSGIKDNDEF